MPRDRKPLAERLRAHRAEMELVLAIGITVLEARALIEQRAARQHWQQTNARLAAKMNGQPAPRQTQTPFVSSEVETPSQPPNGPPPWMHFD